MIVQSAMLLWGALPTSTPQNGLRHPTTPHNDGQHIMQSVFSLVSRQ
jgi:hypothetical protein